MTDDEIEELKAAKKSGLRILWWTDSNNAHEVLHIGPPPKEKDGDEPEPSDCVYFERGYGALYNMDKHEFFVVSPLFN